MARLVYSAIQSVDGYVADRDGRFEWAEPDEEVHAFINDLERSVGTHLLGRRMYEVLLAWETMHTAPDLPAHIPEFAGLWRSTDKVVYSTTLDAPSSARTRIERTFDADAVSSMKESAERDLAVGRPTLAGRAFEAGLVDECLLFLVPAVVGGGTRSLPEDLDLRLELLDERRFASGFVFLRYPSRDGLEHHDRYLAVGLRLIAVVVGPDRRHLFPPRRAFARRRRPRPRGERLGADLHADLRVGDEVEVPRGVVSPASGRGDDDVVVTRPPVDQRGPAEFPRPAAAGGEQERVDPIPAVALLPVALDIVADVLADPSLRAVVDPLRHSRTSLGSDDRTVPGCEAARTGCPDHGRMLRLMRGCPTG
jgi:dihydrofolate reductase